MAVCVKGQRIKDKLSYYLSSYQVSPSVPQAKGVTSSYSFEVNLHDCRSCLLLSHRLGKGGSGMSSMPCSQTQKSLMNECKIVQYMFKVAQWNMINI